jgi:hypothetical protein
MRTTAVAGAVAVLLLGASVTARYGNERMEHFTRSEVNAIDYLYEVAPRGSVLVSWGRNLPWKFQDYEKFEYREVTDEEGWTYQERPAKVLGRIEGLMRENGVGAYLVFTRGQEAENDLLGLSPPRHLERVERRVAASRDFKLIYENADARIFELAKAGRS